jgi:hypothetical protein
VCIERGENVKRKERVVRRERRKIPNFTHRAGTVRATTMISGVSFCLSGIFGWIFGEDVPPLW